MSESQEDTPEKKPAVPQVAKPKFKVTRSPFAPSGDKKPQPAINPKLEKALEPAEDSGEEAQPSQTVKLPKPIEEGTSPLQAENKSNEAASADASASTEEKVISRPKAPASPVAKKATHAPKVGKPKPVAPMSARKMAEVEEEEANKINPIALAVDVIAAGVAVAFAILILLGLKG